LTSQYSPTFTVKNPGKALRVVNSVQTACFILFVLSCNFSISIAQAAAYIGVVAWLVQAYLQQTGNTLKFPLAWPFVAFILASGIATLTAVDVGLSLSGFKKLFKIVIFFWVVNSLVTARPWELLGDLAGWLRLSKFKEYLEKGQVAAKGKNPAYLLVGLLIWAGVISAGVGIVQAVIHPEGFWYRYGIHGSLSNLMTYAQILMLVTCMGFSWAILNPHRSRILIWVGLILMGFAILLTLNRQSWLGLILAMTFILFNKKKIYSLIPVIFAILVFILGPQTLKNRIETMTNLKDYSVNERFVMWKAGWDILKDHPWTGCGFKCQFVIADQYPEHPILRKYTHMHNSPIQLAVDTGILGLTAWISIWIGFFLSLTRQLKHIPKTSLEYFIALGSGAAVIAFLVAGMFENNFYDSEIIILMYFIMALPFAAPHPSQSAPSESAAPPSF
jgi:O-antigen ligase/polysaccharide polymerase Wzy-like membrane protein